MIFVGIPQIPEKNGWKSWMGNSSKIPKSNHQSSSNPMGDPVSRIEKKKNTHSQAAAISCNTWKPFNDMLNFKKRP